MTGGDGGDEGAERVTPDRISRRGRTVATFAETAGSRQQKAVNYGVQEAGFRVQTLPRRRDLDSRAVPEPCLLNPRPFLLSAVCFLLAPP
ncbi:MAG TPA: hypothetical protein VIP79_02285, partial [Gemmatimonadaceae bacterium]